MTRSGGRFPGERQRACRRRCTISDRITGLFEIVRDESGDVVVVFDDEHA